MGLSELFLSLDGFGEPIELNFKGKKRFNTYSGSLITSFIYVVFLLYTLQQFIYFVQKKDFSIQNYEVVDLKGMAEVINMKEQRGGVMFRLSKFVNGDLVDAVPTLDPSIGTLKVL